MDWVDWDIIRQFMAACSTQHAKAKCKSDTKLQVWWMGALSHPVMAHTLPPVPTASMWVLSLSLATYSRSKLVCALMTPQRSQSTGSASGAQSQPEGSQPEGPTLEERAAVALAVVATAELAAAEVAPAALVVAVAAAVVAAMMKLEAARKFARLISAERSRTGTLKGLGPDATTCAADTKTNQVSVSRFDVNRGLTRSASNGYNILLCAASEAGDAGDAGEMHEGDEGDEGERG